MNRADFIIHNDSGFHIQKFIFETYGKACVTDYYSGHYNEEIITLLDADGEIVTQSRMISEKKGTDKFYNGLYLYKDNLLQVKTQGGKSIDVTGYRPEGVPSVKEEISKYYQATKEEKSISLILKGFNGFSRTNCPLPESNTDIELNYGKSFKEIDTNIVERLNTAQSGLFLFSGSPGTGKTSYITDLIKRVEREFIYIPNKVAGHLDTPEFVSFISGCKDSIFVIEDAEDLIKKRETNNNAAAVSTILNITDGMLGKILSISVIMTYNCDDSLIDEALLRKGRLSFKHKFDKLPMEDAQKLLDSLGLKYRAKSEMSLGDIYNIETDTGHVTEKKRIVGFGQA